MSWTNAMSDASASVIRLVPHRIAVPRDHVEVRGHPPVVQAGEGAHHVRGDRDIRREAAQRGDLSPHEVGRLVGDEALPVEVQPVHRRLADGGGRIDLRPVGDGVAPEAGPPGVVERIERAVLSLDPLPERGAAQVAVALAVVLVGEVPGEQRRMVGVALGQLAVDQGGLLAVDRRGEAVVVADAEEVAAAVGPDAQHLGILGRQPGRPRARWRRQHGIAAVLGQQIHDTIQPAELELALGRLELRPGEDRHGHGVAVRQLHQAHVLVPHGFRPLVGVVVAAVQHVRETRVDGGIAVDGHVPPCGQHCRCWGERRQIGSDYFSTRPPSMRSVAPVM